MRLDLVADASMICRPRHASPHESFSGASLCACLSQVSRAV